MPRPVSKPGILDKAGARRIALSYPGAHEKMSWGSPTVFIGKKIFAQVGSHKREAIMLLTETMEERDHLLAADPETFYITDHFRNYKGLLAHIGRLDERTFRTLLDRRFRAIAPKSLLKSLDGEPARPPAARKPRKGR
ncbi:MAG TPA: MmcQ/YjbR family DNA-binding protein [Rhizomicrobium sp.]|nr:MmcQ/YjbR family DNA-binding protein [Rhizomicrobium sp.]